MQLSEHDKDVIRAFASYLDAHYEIFEPEDDGYALYGDMKYHSSNEVVEEYFKNSGGNSRLLVSEMKARFFISFCDYLYNCFITGAFCECKLCHRT